jgi:hypothetical protein
MQVITFSNNNPNGFSVKTVSATYNFQGVVRNYKPKTLEQPPEGYRAWDLRTIHTRTNLSIDTGDEIMLNGVTYKVLQKSDGVEWGFYKYHITQIFQ